MEPDIKHIINLTEIVCERIKEMMPIIRKEINSIIINKNDSIKDIERIFDDLLNYINLGYGKDEFEKLNNYYATVHKENSEIYAGFYDEIFDD
jgi:hypothetical protein